jgi:NTP pyrophosphatase (non-canonical NTP hydrolase)
MSDKRQMGDPLPCLGSGRLCENHSQGGCSCDQVQEALDAETTLRIQGETDLATAQRDLTEAQDEKSALTNELLELGAKAMKVKSERDALAVLVGEIRPEVFAFARLMEATLRKNDHKGGWKGCDIAYLKKRLCEEVVELVDAIRDMTRGGDPATGIHETADVANFAMMIADVSGGLEQYILTQTHAEQRAKSAMDVCGAAKADFDSRRCSPDAQHCNACHDKVCANLRQALAHYASLKEQP